MIIEADEPIGVRALPKSIRDVAETLGLPFALALVAHYGGQEVQFPRRAHDDHPIIQTLGKTIGYALCQFLTGEKIYVPHMKARRSIRMDVLALQDAGRERREIARILGVSQRHVRRMANKHASSSQLNLFD